MVQRLLLAGANVNGEEHGSEVPHEVKDNGNAHAGFTPLFGACVRGRVEVAKLLMRAGADLTILPKYCQGYERVARNRDSTTLLQAVHEIQNERSIMIIARSIAKARNLCSPFIVASSPASSAHASAHASTRASARASVQLQSVSSISASSALCSSPSSSASASASASAWGHGAAATPTTDGCDRDRDGENVANSTTSAAVAYAGGGGGEGEDGGWEEKLTPLQRFARSEIFDPNVLRLLMGYVSSIQVKQAAALQRAQLIHRQPFSVPRQ